MDARERARAQISMGEGLARSTGAPRDRAVDPAELLRTPALRHLHARAARIERAAVKAMSAEQYRATIAMLLPHPSRTVDVARISTIRQARR